MCSPPIDQAAVAKETAATEAVLSDFRMLAGGENLGAGGAIAPLGTLSPAQA